MKLRLYEPPIRLAGPLDAEAILDLLRDRHGEGGVGTFDEIKVRLLLTALLRQQSGVVLAVRGKETIEGSLGLVLSAPWDASDFYLYGLWLFVAEPYRRSTHAKRLIETAKSYADGLGRRLSLEEIITPGTERKLELYRRQMSASGFRFEYPGPDAVAAAE